MATPVVAATRGCWFQPASVTFLALSHYHWDHTANANAFAAATWLVRPNEHDAMFAAAPPPLTQPATYRRCAWPHGQDHDR